MTELHHTYRFPVWAISIIAYATLVAPSKAIFAPRHKPVFIAV